MVPWVLGFIGSISLEALAIVYSNVLRDHINQVRHYHYQNQEIKEQRKIMAFASLTFSNLFIKENVLYLVYRQENVTILILTIKALGFYLFNIYQKI
jgi:hypothetical protein